MYPVPDPRRATYYYLRVSTARQSEATGFAGQQQMCDACHSHFGQHQPPLADSHIFTDVATSAAGKKTAALSTRPGWRRVCSVLRPGDHLIVAYVSRLGRSQLEVIECLLQLHRQGVVVWVAQFPGLCTASPVGIMVLNILAALAEMENQERMVRAKETASVQWLTGSPGGRRMLPPGWRYTDASKTQCEPCPEEQALLEIIFRARDAGLGCKAIAAELRRAGIVRADGGGKGWAEDCGPAYWSVDRVRAAIKAHRAKRGREEGGLRATEFASTREWFRKCLGRSFRGLKCGSVNQEST